MRAVSLAVNVPGPTAAARLAALGASVTKVEPPGGDPLAAAHPAWYDELPRGQRVLTLDLKQAADQAILDEAPRASDLLLTSSRPPRSPDSASLGPRCTRVSLASARSRSSAIRRPTKTAPAMTSRTRRPTGSSCLQACRGRSLPTSAARSWRRPRRSPSCSPASAMGTPGMRRSPSPTLQRRSQRRSDTERPWRAARSEAAFPSTGCTNPRRVDRRRRARAAFRPAAGHGARPRQADPRCARDRLPNTQRRGVGSLGTRARHPAGVVSSRE